MVVIKSDKLKQRRELTFTVERNILGVPTFVLHAKSADKLKMLEHKWKTSTGEMHFNFLRTELAPFPQVEHARYFDALVGIFSTRWNPEGDLWFSIAEVVRFAGLKPSTGASKAVIETIKRYMHCLATWENSWNGRTQKWSSPFIVGSNMWDEVTGEIKRNPRASRKREQLHKITFNKHVAESLKDKHVRVFMTDSLKKLRPDSYAVYRYFYGFSDQSQVHRSIDNLIRVFSWTGRRSRFQPWLEARLTECLDKEFIESYQIKEGRAYVKCRSLNEHNKSAPVIELDEKGIRDKKPKKSDMGKIKVAVSKLTPEALFEEYYARKQAGSLKVDFIEIIEMLLKKNNKEMATSLLRSHLFSK